MRIQSVMNAGEHERFAQDAFANTKPADVTLHGRVVGHTVAYDVATDGSYVTITYEIDDAEAHLFASPT